MLMFYYGETSFQCFSDCDQDWKSSLYEIFSDVTAVEKRWRSVERHKLSPGCLLGTDWLSNSLHFISSGQTRYHAQCKVWNRSTAISVAYRYGAILLNAGLRVTVVWCLSWRSLQSAKSASGCSWAIAISFFSSTSYCSQCTARVLGRDWSSASTLTFSSCSGEAQRPGTH